MAGGVWYLRDWNEWIDNPELGQIIFQFGTRPLLTQESPIPAGWKARLTNIDEARCCCTASPRPASIPARCAIRSCGRSNHAPNGRFPSRPRKRGDHTFQLDVGVKGKISG